MPFYKPLMSKSSKKQLRQKLRTQRDAIIDRENQSRLIVDRLTQDSIFQGARQICCYVSFRSEVHTHQLINQILDSDKSPIVPWCDGPQLHLTEIQSMSELEPRTMGILEPVPKLRESESRNRQIRECDLVVVPGLAFTARGDRLGYGAGHYDRLLSDEDEIAKIAIAFDTQIVSELPSESTDILMDYIVTPTKRIDCAQSR